jgi:hypothetical protein
LAAYVAGKGQAVVVLLLLLLATALLVLAVHVPALLQRLGLALLLGLPLLQARRVA